MFDLYGINKGCDQEEELHIYSYISLRWLSLAAAITGVAGLLDFLLKMVGEDCVLFVVQDLGLNQPLTVPIKL